MSVSTTAVIKDRITTATKGSKIALFTIVRGGNIAIDAVFDNTVTTQKRIRLGCEKYIGSYYGSAGAATAADDMRRAI